MFLFGKKNYHNLIKILLTIKVKYYYPNFWMKKETIDFFIS